MDALFKYLGKIPKRVIPVIGVLLVIIVGIIDHLSGYEISFSMFYLSVVMFVAWFGNIKHAVVISVLSAATWLLADITSGHAYSYFVILAWNSIMRLGFFLLAIFSLSTIRKLLDREQALARIDFLTGVTNSRTFAEIAKREIDKSVRFCRPFTVAYLDIDNFKQVNDTRGHSAGDNLLQFVAETIRIHIRAIDIVARLGGDEFAIFLPETNEENAITAISKVQRHLLDAVKNNNWPVTFSIGAITCYNSCNLNELIKEADDLMYSVKRNGKNSIQYKIY